MTTTIEIDGEEHLVLDTFTTDCEYFALCTNQTDRATRHPVLIAVPTCERCAAKFDLSRDLFLYQTDLGAFVSPAPIPLG